MVAIVVKDYTCKNASPEDLAQDLANGWRQLSGTEIAAAGMAGYEQYVSPLNTTVGVDGSISFTPPTSAEIAKQQFATLRHARDARLTATDKYLLADYPIGADSLAQVKAYRAALRDLPDQPGAPWDGGGELTPWPTKPEV